MPSDAVLLMGCGVVGRAVASLLGKDRAISRVIAADSSLQKASEASELCAEKGVAVELDFGDDRSLASVLGDVRVAVNTLSLPTDSLIPIIRAVVEAGVSYVDANDDPDSLQAVFDSEYLASLADHRAVGVIPGLGASPGQTNTMAQYLSQRLDRIEEVRVFQVDDLRRNSAEQWRRRLAAFGSPALVWQGGDWSHVEPMSHWEEVSFPPPWGAVRCHIVGVQPVSLPVSMPSLTGVRGYRGFSNEESEEAMVSLVRYGFAGELPVQTTVGDVSPRQTSQQRFFQDPGRRSPGGWANPKGCQGSCGSGGS